MAALRLLNARLDKVADNLAKKEGVSLPSKKKKSSKKKATVRKKASRGRPPRGGGFASKWNT